MAIQVVATPLLRNREFEIRSSYYGGIDPTLIIRERSRLERMSDEVTLNHLSVTVDTTLFPDTLKMKVQGDHSGCAKPPADIKTKVAF